MATVKLSVPHTLSIEEAKKRVEAMFDANADKGMKKGAWVGNRIESSGSGAEGITEVTSSSVDIELKLGFALSVFKGKIEATLKEQLESFLKA
jgi:putative polyhydroxyalkanoate system protein